MRIGLDLRAIDDPAQRLALAGEADRLGLWAVLVGGTAGTEAIDAADLAVATSSIHLAVGVDARQEHPLTVAEELAVLDHLSERRVIAVVDGAEGTVDHVERLLGAELVEGVALTPPPAQTKMVVWRPGELTVAELTADLDADAATIDRFRDEGTTHLFVTWPDPLRTLARHLVTRAVGPDFPAIVATMADRIDPVG